MLTINPNDHGKLTLDIEYRGPDECPRIEFDTANLGGPHRLILWDQLIEALVYEVANLAALSPAEALAAARRGADRAQELYDRVEASNRAA
jgi:hypothetical protein